MEHDNRPIQLLLPYLPDRSDDRRVVIEHLTGPLAGLLEVFCLAADLERPLPASLPLEPPVGLVKVKRTYILYKETAIPPGSMLAFHKDQQ